MCFLLSVIFDTSGFYGTYENMKIMLNNENAWRPELSKNMQFGAAGNIYILFMAFQACMSFFCMFNIKEDILKTARNQTVDGPHWLPFSFLKAGIHDTTFKIWTGF